MQGKRRGFVSDLKEPRTELHAYNVCACANQSPQPEAGSASLPNRFFPMSLLHPQLEAFIALVEERSFERAAQRLGITASALSQRIKALEERLGSVLVLRSSPVSPAPTGEKLLRRARAMRLLEEDALADFSDFERQPAVHRMTILANNDSLAT